MLLHKALIYDGSFMITNPWALTAMAMVLAVTGVGMGWVGLNTLWSPTQGRGIRWPMFIMCESNALILLALAWWSMWQPGFTMQDLARSLPFMLVLCTMMVALWVAIFRVWYLMDQMAQAEHDDSEDLAATLVEDEKVSAPPTT